GTFGSRAGAAGSCTTASGAGTVASDDSGDGGGAGVAHAHSATDSVNTGRTAAGRRIIGARLARTPRAMDFPRMNDAQRVCTYRLRFACPCAPTDITTPSPASSDTAAVPPKLSSGIGTPTTG